MTVEEPTLIVVRALERMHVPHYIGGSLASSLHGEPRATNDADLVAALLPTQASRLQQELGNRFHVDVEGVEEAVRTQRSFNLIDEVELAKVDVFCVQRAGYQAAAFARTVRLELQPGDPFSLAEIASAEDTILAKLRWYRLGGEVSDRQWRDLVGVQAAQQGKLDDAYLDTWASSLGVGDLLLRLRASAKAR